MTTTLPYNPEAETALVARLLIEPAQVPTLVDRLKHDDFYDPDCRAYYKAMVKLAGERKPIDLVSIRDEIGRDVDLGVLDITAGHSAPLDTYADIITRDAWRRRTILDLSTVASKARAGGEPRELLAELRDAVALLAEGIEAQDELGLIDLKDHQNPPEPPLLGVLSPEGTTILYGDGGDGKGWVAARWASQLGKKVAILDFEMHPQEWAYRLARFGGSLDNVLYFSPPMTFDQWATEQSARFLQDEGVGYLIIDSAMYASNVEDPYSPNGALAYGRARRRLDNLPALLLAHTTGNVDKVFGSVFWRNESRVVWRLGKDFVTRQRHLECRKANAYSSLEGKRLEIEFSEERGILNLHEHGKPWLPETGEDY